MQADDAHRLQPDHAPTPFSAEEIRAGCPQGRTVTLSVESLGGSFVETIRFVAVDAEGAVQESSAATREGEPLGEPSRTRSSWVDLQRHASFPADATVIQFEALNTPMGRLECRVYRVETHDELRRFWFAVDRPGMPVRVEARSGDQVTSTMTMIGDTVK